MKQVIIVILTVVLFFGAVYISPSYITSKSFEQLDYYVQPDGTVKVYNYSGSDTKVNIPDVINGREVSGIAPQSVGYKTVNGKKVKIDDFLINGYYGTPAQTYADSEGILFNCLHNYSHEPVTQPQYGVKGTERLTCACGFSKLQETEYLKIPNVILTQAEANGEGVLLKWDAVDGITNYNVYRSVEGKDYQFLATVIGNNYVDYDADTSFLKYYVTGVAGENESTKEVKPKTLQYFKSPDLTLDSVKKGIKLSWGNSGSAVKFRVYKKDADGNYKKLLETKNTDTKEYLDTDVKKQSEYFYSVVAVDKDGNESKRSDSGKNLVFGKHSKVVYLTFDDGPSDNTLKILKILKRYKAKATFFVTAAEKPQYMKKITDAGHTIALHTYSHDYKKIYSSTSAYFDDLNKIGKLVYDKTGVDARIIRFPGGSSNTISANYSDGIMTRLTGMVEDIGYKYFDWNVNSGDADGVNVPANKILSNIKTASKGKDMCVVLMHDTSAKDTTVQSLDSICAYYKSKGYEFAALTTESVACHQTVNN